MKFILGKKENMTQFFTEDGKACPATIVKATPLTVTALKTVEKDGYRAVQVGFGEQLASRVSKPVLGHTKEAYQTLKEWRVEDETFALGDTITLESFQKGDKVVVSGVSKGKGFQGVVKRHGFHGDKRTHGRKHSERKPGSIGGGLRNRVPKGMRMAGRMGGDRITVKNLEVLAVDQATNTILLKGAVPGRRGTLLEITS